MIPEKDRQILRDEVEKYDEICRSEYRVSDPDVHVFLRSLDKEISQVFTKESMYQAMEMNIDRLARNAGGSSHRDYDCLEWAYEPESELWELFIDVYRELFHKEAKGGPVHPGFPRTHTSLALTI